MSSVNLLVYLWVSSRYIYKKESIRVKEALCVQMEENPTLDASLGLQV
jgi:peptide/histidine transporter 3/4